MRLTVIPNDRFMSKDGKGLFFDFISAPDIRAIQWDTNHGHIERSGQPNELITDEAYLASYVAAYDAEAARLEAERAEAEWEAKHYKWNGSAWIYDLPEGKGAKLAKIRTEAETVILTKYPVWYQANVANGIYSAAIGDVMKAEITSVITESNRCEDLVDVATTEAKVNAVTPVWPVL